MESLLLGALSYYGNSNLDKPLETNNSNNYNTNLENEMNNIEKKQADNLKNNPDFFYQFDNLTFDNLSKPTAENQAYTTRSGFNKFLQRDLDFRSGYSEFQNTDMHYGVVGKENFVHNNMFPSTSRRETFTNLDSNTRKYENLSGNSSLWNHKHEIETFFDPVKDLTNVNGLPVVADALSNRYITSFKNNNGALPFETDVKVRPGIDGENSAPYAVHRIEPRNVDKLRSEINRKVSYKHKPLETIKKGDIRGYESNLTKFKVPVYRNIDFEDLLPNKATVPKNKLTGEFVHNETARGLNDNNYYGPAIDSTKGQFVDKDKIKFTETKRENFENDFTHSINAINTRPVFHNAESYTNYCTERETENTEILGVHNNNQGNYYKDDKNIAKTTMKQNNIFQDRNLGINGPEQKKSYMFSNDSVLPITNRNTINYNDVGNTTSYVKNSNLHYTDSAKTTIKETTNFDDILNSAPTFKNTHLLFSDEAKSTIKETLIYNQNQGNINSTFQNTNLTLNDEAKPTIKQTTIDNMFILNPSTSFQNNYTNQMDTPKTTIKQTTVENTFVLNPSTTFQNNYTKNNDLAKTTIKQTTIDNPDNLNYIPSVANPYTGLNDKAKTTIKETTVINSIISNIGPTFSGVNVQNNDPARKTIRETTTNQYNGNASNQFSSYIINNDDAKTTIKETTINNNYIGILGGENKEGYINNEDITRTTIRETTLIETPVQNVVANVSNSYIQNDDVAKTTIKETTLHEQRDSGLYDPNQGYYNINDEARITLKDTTLIKNYTGQTSNNVNALRVIEAERNMTSNDKRIQTTLGGRLGNAKSDKIRGDINKETVEYKNKRKLFGYVSNPGKGKDYIVTQLPQNRVVKKTSILEDNQYRIDPIFIDTLNSNPLINDIMHQKNINFNTGK